MLKRKASVPVLSIVLMILASGCDDASSPTNSAPELGGTDQSLIPAQQGRLWSIDEEFTFLAREKVPGGFGGWFIKDGRINIYLVDPSRREAATAVLLPILKSWDIHSRGKPIDLSDIRVRQGQYDFVQLKQWKERAVEIAGLSGVVLLDADESRNRLVFKVENDLAANNVRAGLVRLDIPHEAAIVEQSGPIRFTQSLRERFRPTLGGQMVVPPGGPCALGFNTYRNRTAGYFFVTNSHCTNIPGGEEGTPFYQNDPNNLADLIGTEWLDPPYSGTLPDCPLYRRCRYSDAALIQYSISTDSAAFAAIAKTEFSGISSGSNILKFNDSRFHIVGERLYPTMGQVLDRVGPENGWTFGEVSGTCVIGNSGETDLSYICQGVFDTVQLDGDSGSPVFELRGGNDVHIAGVTWGIFSDINGTHTVFSRLDYIEAELGGLVTF